MGKIRIHYDNEIAGRVFQSVQVSGSQTQLLLARPQHYLLLTIYVLQLFGHL